MKVSVRLDAELDESGVERVWAFTCPDPECHEAGRSRIVALYWENALRVANVHATWHKQKASQG